MSITSRRSLPPFAAAALCGVLALSACGSGSTAEADTDDGLATLETANGDDTDATADADDGADDVASADEAALALSECLRGAGLDVPDIGVDADGNIDLRGAFQELGPGDDSFRTAMEACSSVLEGIEFGGGRGGPGGLVDNTEIQDAMLEFSECIRAEGFEDIGDLTFGVPGGGQDAQPGAATGDQDTTDADGEAPGRGQREGGFGDRNARFAELLGLDPEDPDVIAALDVCSPIIDQAFSDAGVGGPGAGA